MRVVADSPFTFLLVAIARYLMVANKTIFAFVRNAMVMMIYLVLNCVPVAVYSIKGTAVATFVAHQVSAYFRTGYVKICGQYPN
jgi:hypothetical protein